MRTSRLGLGLVAGTATVALSALGGTALAIGADPLALSTPAPISAAAAMPQPAASQAPAYGQVPPEFGWWFLHG